MIQYAMTPQEADANGTYFDPMMGPEDGVRSFELRWPADMGGGLVSTNVYATEREAQKAARDLAPFVSATPVVVAR
jgi:hypothetical protein